MPYNQQMDFLEALKARHEQGQQTPGDSFDLEALKAEADKISGLLESLGDFARCTVDGKTLAITDGRVYMHSLMPMTRGQMLSRGFSILGRQLRINYAVMEPVGQQEFHKIAASFCRPVPPADQVKLRTDGQWYLVHGD